MEVSTGSFFPLSSGLIMVTLVTDIAEKEELMTEKVFNPQIFNLI
jgi:hypothetical protein